MVVDWKYSIQFYHSPQHFPLHSNSLSRCSTKKPSLFTRQQHNIWYCVMGWRKATSFSCVVALAISGATLQLDGNQTDNLFISLINKDVTPTPSSGSNSPPRLTYSKIFSHLSSTILTFLEAVEPYLQRHPYTNIRFRFPSSPYLLRHLFPSFYHNFNVSWSGGALPPKSSLHQHQIPHEAHEAE